MQYSTVQDWTGQTETDRRESDPIEKGSVSGMMRNYTVFDPMEDESFICQTNS